MRMKVMGVHWDKAKILEIESNSKYKKHEESANVTCSKKKTCSANPV
jgi:hypothetical protein